MTQTIGYQNDFETGTSAGIATLGTGWTVQNGLALNGSWSLKRSIGAAVETVFVTGLAAVGWAVRFKWQIDAVQTGADIGILRERSATPATRTCLSLPSTGLLHVEDRGTGLLGTVTNAVGTHVIAANTLYDVEMTFDPSANGHIKVWLDSVLEIDAQHTSNVSATQTDRFATTADSGNTGNWYYDDMRFDINGFAQISTLPATQARWAGFFGGIAA